ncbi:MAG: hypothetical protein KJO50_05050 [Bacteroidia bacterium]|nr:hypothetical protein [Bacteroidia bacterium]
MDRRVAVIDLGSNTFHLLIVELGPSFDSFLEIYRKRSFVYLAKDGIDRINDDRFEAGLECMKDFNALCKQHKVSSLTAIGTSALRSAVNGQEFRTRVLQETGIDIEIVSGEEEARFISLGITHHLESSECNYVIMDIGGGSVEFILMNDTVKAQEISVNIGISELRAKMKYSEPMTDQEFAENQDLIRLKMGKALDDIRSARPECIVGASGPFEIIETIHGMNPNPAGNRFEAAKIKSIARSIVGKTYDERYTMPGMPDERADLSLESMMLIWLMLDKINSINTIVVSPYALKEGIIVDKYFRLA